MFYFFFIEQSPNYFLNDHIIFIDLWKLKMLHIQRTASSSAPEASGLSVLQFNPHH